MLYTELYKMFKIVTIQYLTMTCNSTSCTSVVYCDKCFRQRSI